MEIIQDKIKKYDKITIKDEYGGVPNAQILICASTGHGKTLFLEEIAQKYHKAGYIIIFISWKFINAFESACCQIKPIAKYHLQKLKSQGTEPKEQSCIIYHPFTFGIPTERLLPEMNIFTIPIKSLTTHDLRIITGKSTDSDDIKILTRAISELKDNETIYDVMYKIEEMIKPTKEIIKERSIIKRGGKSNFYSRVPHSGNIKDVSSIYSSFYPFIKDYFLTPKNFDLNIDFKKILKNQKDWHILTGAWINRDYEKLNYLVIIHFLNGLLKEIEEWDYKKDGKARPVLFCFPEGKNLLPHSSKESYVVVASEVFEKAISSMRNAGGCGNSSVVDAQNVYLMKEGARETFNHIYYGKLSGGDIERLAKAYGWNNYARTRLASMPLNHYFFKGCTKNTEFSALFPSFCHAEEKIDFIKLYEEVYPDKVRTYKELLDRMKEIERSHDEIYKQLIKEKDERLKKELDKLEKIKEQKDGGKVQELKKELNEEKKKGKEDLILKCYNDYKNGINFVKIGEKYGISNFSAKLYYLYVECLNKFNEGMDLESIKLEYKINDKDFEFIKRYIEKRSNNAGISSNPN